MFDRSMERSFNCLPRAKRMKVIAQLGKELQLIKNENKSLTIVFACAPPERYCGETQKNTPKHFLSIPTAPPHLHYDDPTFVEVVVLSHHLVILVSAALHDNEESYPY